MAFFLQVALAFYPNLTHRRENVNKCSYGDCTDTYGRGQEELGECVPAFGTGRAWGGLGGQTGHAGPGEQDLGQEG